MIDARDWRGQRLTPGDLVVWCYGWGGMKMAQCEGEIIELTDEYAVVDIHYDIGEYLRQKGSARVPLHRLTWVPDRVYE
jgi:hypothetical protein